MKQIYIKLIVYFISGVCIYDIYCTVKYNEFLGSNELNPVANLLIEKEEIKNFKTFYGEDKKEIIITHVNVSKLVLFKVLGLVAALEIFDWLINSSYQRFAKTIILTLFLIQIFLLLFLTMA